MVYSTFTTQRGSAIDEWDSISFDYFEIYIPVFVQSSFLTTSHWQFC